jgi:hypothetical protein
MKKELVGHCAVDSGQLMIVDPCYALDDARYGDVCTETLANKIGSVVLKGIAGNCIAFGTNTGDGNYPVYVVRHEDGKQIRQIIIELDCWEK